MGKFLGSGGWKKSRVKGIRLHRYCGQFTTAGAAIATNVKGEGFTVRYLAAGGRYRIVFDQGFAELRCATVTLGQEAGGNDAAFPVPSTVVLGSSNAPASIEIETQSAAGTAAYLTGPVVYFDITFAEKTTKASANLSTV